MSSPIFQDLGADLDFQEIWDLQEDLVQRRRDQKIEDIILLLEHAPVYTIGRTRDKTSLRAHKHLPHPVVEINRGGQGTFHGPGQLVGYAILDLTQRIKDLHIHLRNLEEAIIISLGILGITAIRSLGRRSKNRFAGSRCSLMGYPSRVCLKRPRTFSSAISNDHPLRD